MKQILFFLLIALNYSFVISLKAQTPITIKHSPNAVLIENIAGQNIVNFDFLIENKSQDTLELSRVKVSLLDAKRLLLQERFLDNNGTAPSILTIPNRVLNGVSNDYVVRKGCQIVNTEASGKANIGT